MKQGLLHDLLTRGIDENGKLRDPQTHPEQFKESQLGKIPRQWRLRSFGELISSSAFGPRFPASAYSETGKIATLRTTDIDEEGNINFDTMPLANLARDNFLPHLLGDGDLLITRSGTCGVAAVFSAYDRDVLPGAFLIRFRLVQDINPQYARQYFNAKTGKRILLRESEGGVQKNLRGSTMCKIQIPVPSRGEQEGILRILRIHDVRIQTEQRYLKKLKLQKNGLMHDLLTGKVRVRVPEEQARC